MARPFALPAATGERAPGWKARLQHWLLRSVSGRVLLGALAVWALAKGLPLPGLLVGAAKAVLWVYGAWGAVRLARYALRRLLWRIRSKLIVSYLFVALVPVLLLTLLFFIAAVLVEILVAAHLVNEHLAQVGRSLQAASEAVLAGLPPGEGEAASALEARLLPARRRHPGLSATLLRRGRVTARLGAAPPALPGWWKEEADFAGVTGEDGRRDVFRTVCLRDGAALILELPVDQDLFRSLEERSGIHVLSEGERAEEGRRRPRERRPLLRVEGGSGPRAEAAPVGGWHGLALPERVDWATGRRETRPLPFSFSPFDLPRRLSPAVVDPGAAERRNLADILVLALGVVGLVFLVMYAVALVLGLGLARSITRSVHALSLGTERLRKGDFSTRIPVTSRDQLGELAESFNHMAEGIEGLLREQVEKDRLEEELRIARQIQMSLLPPERQVAVEGLRIAALCLPAAEVGGDYYDLLPLSQTRLGVLVADVSGKGTSAALYMAELKGLVLSLSRIHESPARLLCEANRILAANMDARSFITMTYAVADVGTRQLRYARAGHNPLIHLEAASGRTRILTPPGLGLGIDRGDRFDEILQEESAALASGDVFLFFTDGLSEAMNAQAELFGEGRLSRLLAESRGLTSEEIREKILAEVRDFARGASQADDMTMVILKVA
jgi:sigma-B regulation protein RsbU (phosphoserine phosphatase)